jgi:aspartate/methionine/tyrosine aminotransferase
MKSFELRNAFFDQLCEQPDLKWLGQNTNHFEPHPAVRQAILEAFDSGQFQAYAPPLGFERLRKLIREDLGLPEACVMVTDGAVQGLYSVCSRFCEPGSEFLTTDPSWAWPMSFAQRAGAKVVQMPIYNPEQHYKLTVQQLRSHVTSDTKVIYLVDPNNPLGTCHTEDEIRAFTDIAREVGAYFIHDATYFQFADQFSPAFRFYPEKTLMMYSFSKWLGFAGLRLGAVVASEANIELLSDAPPNNLGSNVLSQKAAIAGLEVKSQWFPAIKKRLRHNQQMVFDTVARIPGLDVLVFPSQANFLVVETVRAGIKPESLVAALQERGIMIRQGSYHTQAFGDQFVKISLSVPEAWVELFCQELPAAVKAASHIKSPPKLF